MTLFITWLVFPLVLTALAVGCGLLVERVAGIDLPGVLLPATGLALIIVVAQFFTLDGRLAELTTPFTVALAVVGFGLSLRALERGFVWWAMVAAVAVFVVYAGPIVLSGQATFAGYIKLDDTATWMALTDRVMDNGRSLSGLPPSTYEATLDFNLASGYPVGIFLPLGVGRSLVGQDVAWVIQPYMAYMGALLALGAWAVTEPLVEWRWLRALAAFLGAQSTLLFGYYLWGGIKEIAAAAFLASIAGMAAFAIREWDSPRPLVPLAVMSAALIGILSGGGIVWLAPMLVVVLVVLARTLERRDVAIRTIVFAAVVVVMCLPVLIPGGLLPPTSSPLTSETALGNLYHPLSGVQLFGVWPTGDFRVDPSNLTIAYVLIGVVALAAVIGLALAIRARSWAILMYLGGALISSLVIFAIGSPWVGGKALATASPAIPLMAAAGGAILFARARYIEGGVLVAVLAVGVLWSNALAYRDVSLAPRAQLAELQKIARIIGDTGPTLMTEYQPYGVRHFLRDAAPEGASELRRRTVPLVTERGPCPPEAIREQPGGLCSLRKGTTADIDRFQLGGILTYRTLVLRRGPGASRPPSPYHLVYEGSYYDVWQRPANSTHFVIEHLGLGTATDPAGVPKCAEVDHLAQQAGPGGTLAAVARDPVVIVPLTATQHPAAWNSSQYRPALIPRTPGTLTARVQIPQSGDYSIYLGGSVRPQVDLSVDGEHVSSIRAFLNNSGEHIPFGDIELTAGSHTISITFHGSDLHPGSGGTAQPIGPLGLTNQDAAQTRISYFPASQADQLCGRPWDWIEATSGPA